MEIILNKNGNLKKLEPNVIDKVIAALYCKELYRIFLKISMEIFIRYCFNFKLNILF